MPSPIVASTGSATENARRLFVLVEAVVEFAELVEASKRPLEKANEDEGLASTGLATGDVNIDFRTFTSITTKNVYFISLATLANKSAFLTGLFMKSTAPISCA